MKIIWTRHGEDRQKEWEKKLEITRQEVENILKDPEQIVSGVLAGLGKVPKLGLVVPS